MKSNIRLGTGIKQYRWGDAQQVTLLITEECNLRCRYCYEVDKGPGRVMSREVAYRAIDFILSQPPLRPAIVIEFTGGEATLEMALVADITRYVKQSLSRLRYHPWQTACVFLLSTNGTTYGSEPVQQYLWENRFQAQAAITIDGTKEKHDANRIFKNGAGSYECVAENVGLWVRQFSNALTKVTISSADLPYTCDSIIHLWDLGIKDVAANVVFEDVWKPNDPQLFEAQLRRLADIALEKGYCATCNTSLFWIPENVASRRKKEGLLADQNWCGTGTMVTVDGAGNLYPCIRFMDFALARRPGRKVGTIYDGFDQDKLRSYQCLLKSLQSPQECLACDMQEQCSWCTGYNYDMADSDTMFQRMTYICEMHKAQVRANQYYWEQLKQKHGVYVSEAAGYKARLCAC